MGGRHLLRERPKIDALLLKASHLPEEKKRCCNALPRPSKSDLEFGTERSSSRLEVEGSHTLNREENCNSPRRPRCSDSPTQGTHLRCRFPTTPISDAFPSNPAECMAFFKRIREPERRGGGGRIYISTPKFNRARVETPPTHPAPANSLLFLMMLLWLLYMAVQIGKQWQTVCQKL